MQRIEPWVLEKHALGIEAARNYYVLNQGTGYSDDYYTNVLEAEARKDGLELRDWVFQELQGKRSKNAEYIGKVEKSQVTGNMEEAIDSYVTEVSPEIKYLIPKYDGSSVAAYYDTTTGRCIRVVTIGGTNLGSEGIDQTEKLARYFPNLKGYGIRAIQCEALVALEHGFAERSRQEANGLINSAYEPMSYEKYLAGSKSKRTEKDYQKYLDNFSKSLEKSEQKVDKYLTLRCFRYFLDPDKRKTRRTRKLGYRRVLESLPVVRNSEGDIKFCGGFVFEREELGNFVNTDIWETPTGTFLVDGVVGYTEEGVCVRALKYKDAGRGEATTVRGLKWTNQVVKGKDSWSCNAIIDPITVRGSKVTKPSVGSITKMVERKLSPGAKVTIIMTNSTIPQVSEVLEPGNGDFQWPQCSCGYQLGPKDAFGIRLKCGNALCTERYERMLRYLQKIENFEDIDLTALLVVDGVNWKTKIPRYEDALATVYQIVADDQGPVSLFIFLQGFLTTELQKRNLNLVVNPGYAALSDFIKR